MKGDLVCVGDLIAAGDASVSEQEKAFSYPDGQAVSHIVIRCLSTFVLKFVLKSVFKSVFKFVFKSSGPALHQDAVAKQLTPSNGLINKGRRVLKQGAQSPKKVSNESLSRAVLDCKYVLLSVENRKNVMKNNLL
jgi:hypothetical protein